MQLTDDRIIRTGQTDVTDILVDGTMTKTTKFELHLKINP